MASKISFVFVPFMLVICSVFFSEVATRENSNVEIHALIPSHQFVKFKKPFDALDAANQVYEVLDFAGQLNEGLKSYRSQFNEPPQSTGAQQQFNVPPQSTGGVEECAENHDKTCCLNESDTVCEQCCPWDHTTDLSKAISFNESDTSIDIASLPTTSAPPPPGSSAISISKSLFFVAWQLLFSMFVICA